MKVGDEPVHDPERVSRADEEARDALIRFYPALAPRYPLQGARGRGADGDDSPAVFFCPLDLARGFRFQKVPLSFHVVLLDYLLAHRLEGARSHVQSQKSRLHALRLEPIQELRRKVKPGGRRRHRARTGGVDRLVALPIARLRIAAPLHVRRQRRLAQLRELLHKIPLVTEP